MHEVKIQVQTSDGRRFIYEVDRTQNVGELKKIVGRKMNVPMDFSRLVYKGRVLSNEITLEDVGVERMSTLELAWQPPVLTPKENREKEIELDQEKTGQKAGQERSARELEWDIYPQPDNKKEDCKPLELGSASSEDMDFQPAYWCYTNSADNKSNNALELQVPQYVAADAGSDALADADAGEGAVGFAAFDEGAEAVEVAGPVADECYDADIDSDEGDCADLLMEIDWSDSITDFSCDSQEDETTDFMSDSIYNNYSSDDTD